MSEHRIISRYALQEAIERLRSLANDIREDEIGGDIEADEIADLLEDKVATRPYETQPRDYITMQVEGNAVRVLVHGEVVFEYLHPNPETILPCIRVGQDRRYGGPASGKVEVQVDWHHGSAWCNSGWEFTRIVHPSLLPQDA